jgi:hypothetical protein
MHISWSQADIQVRYKLCSYGPARWHSCWSWCTEVHPRCELVYTSPEWDAYADQVYAWRIGIPWIAMQRLQLDVTFQGTSSSCCASLLHCSHNWQYRGPQLPLWPLLCPLQLSSTTLSCVQMSHPQLWLFKSNVLPQKASSYQQAGAIGQLERTECHVAELSSQWLWPGLLWLPQ